MELGPAAFAATVSPLRSLARSELPVVGWDTEYDSRSGSFVCFQLWGASGGKLFTQKMTVDSLARACRELGVVGDSVYLVSFFSIAELRFLPVVRESFDWKLFGTGSLDASFYSDRYRLELKSFDLARFFDRQSLAQVAESFGRKKLDFDTTRVSLSSLRSKAFREYALHDARLCYEILGDLRESLGGPDPLIHKTAPGCAAALFRFRYLTRELRPPEPRHRLLAMLSCWGGRSEALRRGSFPRLWEYDLQSAYPRAAQSLGELPVARSWRSIRTIREVSSSSRLRAGVARVRFAFRRSELYPCLPVLSRGVLLYPLKGETFATLDEIRLALEIGADVRLVEGYGYERGTTALKDYMDELLEERAKAQGARKVALKLLANSLIGKLAQRVVGVDVEKLRKLALDTGISIAKLARITVEEAKALGVQGDPRIGAVFMPEWNGLITGRVRAQISRAARDFEAVYVATDAIWTTRKIRPPEGFSLKREGPGVVARTRLGLIAEKGKIHVASHGIQDKSVATRLLTEDLDGEIGYAIRRPTKLKEALRSGKTFGRWETYERIASAGWDFKRRLAQDGTTSPWESVREFEAGKAEALRARRRTRAKAGGRKR